VAFENAIMDEGFRFFDIILFAMVAAFIVLRLRSVLGRRTGHERPPPDAMRRQKELSEDNVIPLPDRSEAEIEAEAARIAGIGGDAAAGLAQVKIADPRFNTGDFLKGSRGAYELIIGAFAGGDTKTLRPLLNDDVYENFEGAVREREARKQTLSSTLVAIKSANIVAARMNGREAEVTVEFVSDIINVLSDESGQVIEGDPTTTHEVTDVWTFSHNTRSSDPNWTLIETGSAE
jgi:predicted lipid-binding transport protein (Tim44 family)